MKGKGHEECGGKLTAQGINLFMTCEEIGKAFLSLPWCGDFRSCVVYTSKPILL